MASLATPLLLAVFLGCAVVIWFAGIQLSKTTDAIDARFGLGEALGGLIVLGVATSLPEAVITVSACLHHHLDLAIGNLIGGVAIQTVVLALLDARASKDEPLSYLVGSLTLVIEAAAVISTVVLAVIGTQLPSKINLIGISPVSIAIVFAWVLSLLAVNRTRKGNAWKAEAKGARPGRPHRRAKHPTAEHPFQHQFTPVVIGIFAVAALLTLVAGYFIEESGNALAGHFGIGSGIFGATVSAAATALPEVSTGFGAVKLGDYQLAMSDIFGGNSFMPCLFLLGDIVAGTPLLVAASPSDIWMAGLGVLVTAVFVVSLILRPQRCRLRLGFDSRLIVVLYLLGIIGLVVITGGK